MTARIKNFLLYSLIFFLPTQLGRHFFPDYTFISGVRIDYLSPTIYFTDILVFLILIFNFKSLKEFFSSRTPQVLLVIILTHIVLSLSWQIALYKWTKIIAFSLLFHIIRNRRLDHKLILKSFLSGAAIQLGLCIMQFASGHAIEGVWYWLGERYYRMGYPNIATASLGIKQFVRPYGTFSHPNSLAGFYVLIYTFALFSRTLRPYTIMKNVLLLISSMLIFISFSKTAIMTFAIMNILYMLSRQKRFDCALCFFSKITVIVIVSTIVLMTKGDAASAEKRINLIDNATAIIINYPLTGVGLGNYLIAGSEFPNKYPYFFLQPVHNIILLLFAETGLIIGGFIIYKIYKTLKPHLKQEHVYSLIFAVLLTGILDHYWLTLQQNMLLIPVIFGIALNPKTKPTHSLQQGHL